MKQLLAWTGSANFTITSEALMAVAEKFNLWISLARRLALVSSVPAEGGVDHGAFGRQHCYA